MKEENKMTDKTEMNKVQKEFVEFVEKYTNKEYKHVYWFFWEEEDEYGINDEWLEEVYNEFCKEYNYEWEYFEEKIYENRIS